MTGTPAGSTSTSSTLPPEDKIHFLSETRRPNPIAALIRQGAMEAGRLQGSRRATTKVQRMINSLQWRQAHSKDALYPLLLDSGVVLEFRQLQAGEVTGLGTGATVWPAAHVLAKYLERRFVKVGVEGGKGGMEGLRVVDLGSGTGVAGIVAAALGAKAFLTDQEQLLFLMEENAERATRARANESKEGSVGRLGSTTGTTAKSMACSEIRVMAYDWGMEDKQLSPPLDVVLASDCVLPKLYPIKPLVEAIDRLSGPDTVTIMSYEHRHYQAFDPRRKFEELAAAKGLVKTVVAQAQHHPIFSADDIEIWEVRRRRKQPLAQSQEAEGRHREPHPGVARSEGRTGVESVAAEMLGTEEDVVIFSSSPANFRLSSCDKPTTGAVAKEAARDQVQTVVGILGERHELAQTPSGAIGCYLWPSSVVMARHIVAHGVGTNTANANATDISTVGGPLIDNGATVQPFSRQTEADQHPTRMLELGSGVGLVAMVAALLGWDVLSTDKADVLPLLELNVKRCLSSTRRKHAGTVDVVEYEWGTDAKHLMAGRICNSAGAGCTDYDVVICTDCVYARTSVGPLLATLCQVCGENTLVLVTNELRTAFDEFLRSARALNFEVEDVHVPESQMVVDAASNQRPKPIALKRLRRKAGCMSTAEMS